MKHQIGGRSLISWLFLLLACLALVGAGGLLLSGCGSSGPEYQQVVNEVNQKYGAHMKVDFNGTDITPEQLRAHLEAVAQSQSL